MRKSILKILTILFILTPSLLWAAIDLSSGYWSTTFDCAEWTSPNALSCDGLGKGGDYPCTDGTGSHFTQITTGANMATGGGGRGYRNWHGPCKNNNSGSVYASFTHEKELWVRWYIRYPTNFGWTCSSGPTCCTALQGTNIEPKLLYFNLTSYNQFQPYLYGWDGLRFYCYTGVNWSPTPNTGVGWDTMMVAGADDPLNPGHKLGDGLWHYFEVHAKAPTSPTGRDGILQMWIDGRLVMSFNTVWWNTDDTGWNLIQFDVNYQGVVNDNLCKGVDVDDIAISTTGYIGPLGVPPSTPPVMTNGYPINNQTFNPGTTQVTMSLATDVNANCKYDSTDTTYALMANTFTTGQGTTSHSQVITGLTDGSSYTRYARCDVAAGGYPDTSSLTLSWNISTPPIPPVLSNSQPANGTILPLDTPQIAFGVITDKSATCKYGTSDVVYASLPNTFTTDSTPQTAHSSTLTGLTNSTSYTYYVRCNDGAGGINLTGYPITFSVDSPPTNIFFTESFEDTNFTTRGWYDGIPTSVIDNTEYAPVSGSTSSIKVNWAVGNTKPTSGNGYFTMRHKFAEIDSVYMSYWIKHTTNWAGSGVGYHPHMFMTLTNQDTDYAPLAYNPLNVYVQERCTALNSPVGTCLGVLEFEIQDSANINSTDCSPGVNCDLVSITETRAVGGCNGDSDGYDHLDCYYTNGHWYNDKIFPSSGIYLRDTAGQYYKNDWHFIETYWKLNTISGGKGQRDGIMKMWYDGVLVFDYDDVVYRTATYPNIKFNQLIFAPYIGVGSPVNNQGFWIDELTVSNNFPFIDALSSTIGPGVTIQGGKF